MFHTQVSAITSNIILKFSRSRLKFYKHGIGIESVICNLHMSGLSFSRAKVAQNENLLDNDSLVLSSLVTKLQVSYRRRLCDYTRHVRHGVSNPEQNWPIKWHRVFNHCTMMQGYKRLGTQRGSAQSQPPPPLLSRP